MSGLQFSIDGKKIGASAAPYVIAELSGNHNGDIERAFAIMEAAKKAGADAVKLQTYTADTMTIDHDGPGFQIESGPWSGQTLYKLYQQASTPWEWHEALFAKGRELGITVFSTPFDATAVDLLETLGAPAYKIASFEAADLPLIERVSATGKPVIISTGMANRDEIAEAVNTARSAGCRDLALLHCVSAYPAAPEEYNLRTIEDMANRFGAIVGLSDHTMGSTVAVAAVAVGAALIEKHLTLRRTDGGPDSGFSAEPEEFGLLCDSVKVAWRALGDTRYSLSLGESENAIFRRSLYAVADIDIGELLDPENIRAIRPGFGLPPKEYKNLMGRRAKKSIRRGTPLSWDLVE